MGKKRLVVLTGAGMSAESGISTFRDSDGLWEQYPVQKVASIEGFRENPQLVLDFYTARRRDFVGCEFRLYYTSRSKERQSLELVFEDNHGQRQTVTIEFNHKEKRSGTDTQHRNIEIRT